MIFICHIGMFANVYYETEIMNVFSLVFGCFMAWFFFKSGIYYKEKNTWDLLISTLQKFIIPYICLNVIFGLIDSIVDIINYENRGVVYALKAICKPYYTILLTESTRSGTPLWFLLSLFFVVNIFNLLKKHIPAFVICIFAFCFTYILHEFQLSLYYITNVFNGLFFYSTGYLLQNKQYERNVFVTALFVYIIHFIMPCKLNFRGTDTDNLVLSDLYALSGIIFFNNIAKIFINRRLCILSNIGKDSMFYLCYHFPVLFIARECGFICNNGGGWITYVVLCAMMIIYLLLLKIFFRIIKVIKV